MPRTAFLVCAGVLLALPALAQDCAHGTDLGAIEAAVQSAPGCRAAGAIARACALGSGGDVHLSGLVTQICERDFLAGLDRRGRASYGKQRAACLAKYRDRSGSMYRSAEAFCQASVAERLSRRALGAGAVR